MLGALKNSRRWYWTAVGKHPVAVDYIRLTMSSSLLEAVCDWMTKGFDQVNRTAAAGQTQHSWRFWLRGAKRDGLLFGLGRDSSDRIGRPYPFFIMGEGTLKSWEQHWERLPIILDSTWQRMEAIAAGRYEDITMLSDHLDQLPTPSEDSRHLQKGVTGDVEVSGEAIPPACREELSRSGRLFIDVGPFHSDNPAVSISRRLGSMKHWFSEPPTAVFLGGTLQQTYLAVVDAPLNQDDFLKFWSS